MSHIIENIVYLELLRRNYQVDIGKNKNLEIDFIVRKNDNLYYIQVAFFNRTRIYKRKRIKCI